MTEQEAIKALELNGGLEINGNAIRVARFFEGLDMAIKALEKQVPVVHGYNDNQNFHEADEFKCSVCGLHLEDWSRRVYDEDADNEYWVEYAFKYCPNCGAKMKGGTE